MPQAVFVYGVGDVLIFILLAVAVLAMGASMFLMLCSWLADGWRRFRTRRRSRR
jgi:hypothetical protein